MNTRPLPCALPRAAALLGLGLLVGCGGTQTVSSSAPSTAVAVVVGAHANAPQPEASAAVLEHLKAAVDTQATAAVVVDSGTPEVLVQGALRLSSDNPFAAEQEKAALLRKLSGAIAGAAAEHPEANPLAALDLAARTIADTAGPKTVLVIDSGLQTTAPLRFQDAGLLMAEPAEVADFLAERQALPDLEGVDVVFSGLGDTAPPQEPLPPAQRKNLVAIWTAVAERAGARVTVLQTPLSAPPKPDLAGVSVVPVAPPVLAVPATATAAIELRDESVSFLPDEAVYRDAELAAQTLAPLAQRIVSSSLRVHLTGATSSAGSPDGRRRLSLLRAEAVKRSLVAAGVPAAHVTTAGVGSDWSRHVPDRDAQGTLLPGPAAQNRMVLAELRQT